MKILSKEGGKLVVELTIDLDSSSMLNSEEHIQSVLNDLGCLATKEALSQFDTDGMAIDLGGERWTSKGQEKKNFKARMEK